MRPDTRRAFLFRPEPAPVISASLAGLIAEADNGDRGKDGGAPASFARDDGPRCSPPIIKTTKRSQFHRGGQRIAAARFAIDRPRAPPEDDVNQSRGEDEDMTQSIAMTVNGRQSHGHGRRSRDAAALCAARQSRAARPALRLRPRPMRRLHRPCRRQGGALLRHCRCPRCREQKIVTLEGLGTPREAASGAAGLHRRAGGAMRLLHQRHDHAGGGVPRQEQEAERGRHQECARQQSLPLRHPCAHRARGQARRRRRHEGGST